MTADDPPTKTTAPAQPTLTPHAEAARAARLAREAAALRENLRRRKQQKPPAKAANKHPTRPTSRAARAIA